MQYTSVPAWAIYAVLAALSCGAYLNTLFASFAFDDNFAVITNGDVTDPNKPLGALFKNDFWGTRIWNEQSHKSYRPLTVLAFRCQRIAGAYLFDRLGWRHEDASQWRGVNPIPFHASNILLHALVTCLVYQLAKRLCVVRDAYQPPWPSLHAPEEVLEPDAAHHGLQGREFGQHNGAVPAAGTALRHRRAAAEGAGGEQPPSASKLMAEPQPAVDGLLERYRAEAALAAALFSLHPIHTEAVAGIVGQAELLSAALSIVALLLYFRAAEEDRWSGMDARMQPRRAKVRAGSLHASGHTAVVHGDGANRGAGTHWLLVGGALALAGAAALAKEIGITTVGAMALYDAFLLPWPPLAQTSANAAVTSNGLAGALGGVRSPALRRWAAGAAALARSRKVARPFSRRAPAGVGLASVLRPAESVNQAACASTFLTTSRAWGVADYGRATSVICCQAEWGV